ncbi:MAG: hypothetical protein ACFFAS_15165 [Promethearchaeota archaeon]
MSETTNRTQVEAPTPETRNKTKRVQGIIGAIVYTLTSTIYIAIPTKLISTFWVWLNGIMYNDKPVYTLALLVLFLYIITLIISVIYIAATVRAIAQSKNSDLGIPKGVQWFGAISTVFVVSFMIFWFVMTGQVAIFSLMPP